MATFLPVWLLNLLVGYLAIFFCYFSFCSTMNTTLDRLHTDEGAAAFRSLWDGNIRQHSVLYPVLYNGVKSSYVNTLIGLLNTLRGLQMRFRTNEEVLPSHIFVGIAVLHRGSDDYKNVEKYFNKVIKVTSPDVLVLRTHYVQKDDGNRDCHVTGPAIWQGKFSADQPAFLESLRFLQKVTIPDYLAIVLSFTEASRWYRWDANDSSFVLGEKCVVDFHTDLFPRSMLCNGTPGDGQSYASKHRQTQQMYAVQNRNSYGLVFDNKDTIRTKMCWTSTSFKYKIGWAMFDLEFADTANACRDPTYTKGFALLHWMKHYMRNGFHEASECEPF